MRSCTKKNGILFRCSAKRSSTLDYGESAMSGKVVGLVAAAALLASVGIANAEGPVKLTDGQLDKITAGASPTSASVAANVATTGALDFARAANTAVAANLAATAAPKAIGSGVAAGLGAAARFHNLVTARPCAALTGCTP